MFHNWLILIISFAYLGILFAIATYGDKRASIGRSVISNPYIYALSLAVYCTAWTFYGSVGRAVNGGLSFLPVYLGPTLMAALWWLVLRKIIRISKRNRITSIADFIASRYGKSTLLGGAVTIVAMVGVVPYVALQLKAISNSVQIITASPNSDMNLTLQSPGIFHDITFYIAILLALFTILFGTRHLDATERHEGLVAAIAFESIIKLIAFLVVGFFVTYGIFDGFGDIFVRARTNPAIRDLITLNESTSTFSDWSLLIFLSMLAVMFLPRQFQVAVIENVNEKHIGKAIWLFPLYLLVINIFVLPIAFGGMLYFPAGQVDADTFVLTLPMAERQDAVALLVFLGGLSAATGMVIVEAIALSTMMCNDLVMPILLRLTFLKLDQRKELRMLLLTIRRGAILLVMLFGYLYFHFIGEKFTLVSIGLISFAAVAQFAPAIIGGIFWKEGSRNGALVGLAVGFLLWSYTLPFPALIGAGWLPEHILSEGPMGIALLRPQALFGLEGFSPITHGLFWSLLINSALYVLVSLFSRRSGIEHTQASLFVDVYKFSGGMELSNIWRGRAVPLELHQLLRRFLGKRKADEAFTQYARIHHIEWRKDLEAGGDFVNYVERLLAGAVGAATARVMIASVVKEEPLSLPEVMQILDETQQVLAYSRALEQKSEELEKATEDLKEANLRLQELDRLKDDFVSTVTHELRTPLTSVRAFSEILYDNPDMDLSQRQHFLGIIIKESERLTRLINQLLDLQKIESDTMEWKIGPVDVGEVIQDAINATSQLMLEKDIHLKLELPEGAQIVNGDRDQLIQVMLNLISNAIKFSTDENGVIIVRLLRSDGFVQIDVEDNGIGIDPAHQELIFEKFRQLENPVSGRPGGSGLGLAITRRIVEYHQGRIWVESVPGSGAKFSFTLKAAEKTAPAGTNAVAEK